MTNVNAELQGTLDACQHFHSVLVNEYGLHSKRVHLLTLQTLAIVAIRVTVCPADARALWAACCCQSIVGMTAALHLQSVDDVMLAEVPAATLEGRLALPWGHGSQRVYS